MTIEVVLSTIDVVKLLRQLHRQEMNCQIVLDSWLERGWTDPYLLRIDDRIVGYGLVGGVRADPKDTVVEFYVQPLHRGSALPLFREMMKFSQARQVEAQTNDKLLTQMLYDCAANISSDVILFDDALATNLPAPGCVFRKATQEDADKIFEHKVEPAGDWVLEVQGTIAATGGFLCHYNPPYGDIYMEVVESHRNRGLGSYLVQELKRVCYEQGKLPAARCGTNNAGSRATLQKAGMLPCARVLLGTLAT